MVKKVKAVGVPKLEKGSYRVGKQPTIERKTITQPANSNPAGSNAVQVSTKAPLTGQRKASASTESVPRNGNRNLYQAGKEHKARTRRTAKKAGGANR